MKYNFKLYNQPPKRYMKDCYILQLRKNGGSGTKATRQGRITLNGGMVENLKIPQDTYAELYMDFENKVIAIHLTQERTPTNRIVRSNGTTGRNISALDFIDKAIKEFGYEVKVPYKYKLAENGMIVLLKDKYDEFDSPEELSA